MSKGQEIDLLAALAVNFGATKMAAGKPSMRVHLFGIGEEKQSQWLDSRLLLGAAALAAYEFLPMGDMGKRAAFDGSSGLLHSYTATEVMRAEAIRRCEAGGKSAEACEAPYKEKEFKK